MSDDVTRITVRHKTHSDFVIRLARDITDPDDFADELQILASADKNDTIKLQIVTGGGLLDTGIMFAKAMRECEAPIKGWIGPTCASAGTVIALECDEWEVDDMSSFMIHTGSFGVSRIKTPDAKALVDHQAFMMEKMIRITYDGFLTEEEIERVIDGKDYYFEGEELALRLERFAIKRDEKRQAMIEEFLAECEEDDDYVLDDEAHNGVDLAPVEEEPLPKRGRATKPDKA